MRIRNGVDSHKSSALTQTPRICEYLRDRHHLACVQNGSIGEEHGRINPAAYAALQENIKFAETLGAKVVRLKSSNVADALLEYARENGITHVIFGQSARTRWDIFWKGSVINRFLREVKDAAVHVIPLEKDR